jgi:hypothetical protein
MLKRFDFEQAQAFIDVDQDGFVEFLLAAEVVVDHPLVNPGGVDDAIDGCAVVAVGGKHLDRRSQYSGFRVALLLTNGHKLLAHHGR